jgi:transposase
MEIGLRALKQICDRMGMSQEIDSSPLTAEVLSGLSPEARAVIAALVQYYERKLAIAEERIAALEDRLNSLQRKTPKNSSVPPSSQHPHDKPVHAPKEKSPRKPGGQPGHPQRTRPLIPSEECNEVILLTPSACRQCGTELSGNDPEPLRHQVWELPEIKPLVTEYQQQRLTCACCGVSTCAELPSGVPTGQSGPRLIALATLMMAYFRLSKRRTAAFFTMLLNQPCSVGHVVNMQNMGTSALRPCFHELVEALPQQAVVNIDETPTKQQTHKAWLWTFVAAGFTVFGLRLSRGAGILHDWLGLAYEGVVGCDRARMYFYFQWRQWCWAHLKRDFQAISELKGSAAASRAALLGRQLLEVANEMFHHWHRVRDGTLTRRGFKRHANRLQGRLYMVLEEGQRCGHAPTEATCNELFTHFDTLWTFLDHENVEPTNNASERSLRHAVIWRKLSFGTQSVAGSRFVETLLTVVETCRQQNRNVFAFIADAVQRRLQHQPPPSLLPGS